MTNLIQTINLKLNSKSVLIIIAKAGTKGIQLDGKTKIVGKTDGAAGAGSKKHNKPNVITTPKRLVKANTL